MNLSESIIRVEGVTKRYGDHEVLKGIDLEVSTGQNVGIVGNNGQGKTTLMKTILGLLQPDQGRIFIKGEEVGHPRASAQKRLIGYLPESMSFYPNLSGYRTLRFFADLKSLNRDSVDKVLELVDLTYAAQDKVKTYSKGMKQRLGLAQALLGSPELLLLDEPTNGLDPYGIREFYQTLSTLQAQGVSILMASHLLAEMEPHIDVLAILHDGVFSRVGDLDSLAQQASLKSEIRFSHLNGAKQALEKYSIVPVYNEEDKTYSIFCDKGSKKEILSLLLHELDNIDDLVIREPGLESLFHHVHEVC